MEENTSVIGNLLLVRRVKAPLLLVMEPDCAFLIWMLTASNGFLVSWSNTVPEISIRLVPWAKEKLKSKK